MEFNHAPVLPEETIDALDIRADGTYVDGTLGGGGHALRVCERLGERGVFLGIDRDADALAAAKERLQKADAPCRKIFVRDNFAHIKDILREQEIAAVDGALLDLGVSSFQLDNPERGFSYMQDAPLDMRMDQRDELTAYEVVNQYDEKALADILRRYGEERWAGRIASFIGEARQKAPISSSAELVEIIKSAIPANARRDGPHPAKRTFQALRIEVNDELGILEGAVEDLLDVLAPGGRLAVITFHSLEDRIVKNVFQRRANPCTCPPDLPVCVCGKVADIKKVTGKPITAKEKEVTANPRSRSAKLRVAEKIR